MCGNTELVDELVSTLTDEGLQSDERFIEDFIHQRISRGQGPLKIRQELRQRGIDAELIRKFLEQLSVDWLAQAERVRVKKFGAEVPGDYQRKAKQSRFLYGRGFDSEQINQLLKTSGSQ